MKNETPWEYFQRRWNPSSLHHIKIASKDVDFKTKMSTFYHQFRPRTERFDTQIDEILKDYVVITDDTDEIICMVKYIREQTELEYTCTVIEFLMKDSFRLEQCIAILFEWIKNFFTSAMVTSFVNKVHVIFRVDFTDLPFGAWILESLRDNLKEKGFVSGKKDIDTYCHMEGFL